MRPSSKRSGQVIQDLASMKKFILFLVVVGVIGGSYYVVRNFARVTMEFMKGELRPVTRGDLDVPITASGNIQPASVRKLKSKASGEITHLPFKLGARVREKDLVVQLLDVDERRTYERALADEHRALIALDTAKINLRQRETTTRALAEAKLKQAKAGALAATSKYNWAKSRRVDPNSPDPFTQEEWDAIEASYLSAEAGVLAAQADLDQTAIAVELAKEDVKNAEETLKATKAATLDANERLIETSIRSPIDGMVLAQPVQVGEIVQGGKMTLMGGTELLQIADISAIYAVVNVDEADIGQVHKLAPVSARPGSATRPADAGGDEHRDVPASGSAGGPASTQPAEGGAEGQIVHVKVESFPDEDFQGVITQISPQSEMVAAVATFKVWIRITSSNVDKLVGLLNTQAEAHFMAKAVHNAVLVPYDAVQKNPNGDGYGVYVPDVKPGSTTTEPRFVKCTLGADNGIVVEVREGVQEGQMVYTKLPAKRDDKK